MLFGLYESLWSLVRHVMSKGCSWSVKNMASENKVLGIFFGMYVSHAMSGKVLFISVSRDTRVRGYMTLTSCTFFITLILCPRS